MSLLMSTSQNPMHKANYCSTCLAESHDDVLHPCSEDMKIILKHLLYDFDLDAFLELLPPDKEFKLCQSCNKTLNDMVIFKESALKCMRHLKNLWHSPSLQRHGIPGTSQTPFESTITVTPEVEIKEEPDPLETVKFQVFSHITSDAKDTFVDIKEDTDDNNNGSDTDTADSSENDLDDAIQNHVPKNDGMFGIEPKKVKIVLNNNNLQLENKKKRMLITKTLGDNNKRKGTPMRSVVLMPLRSVTSDAKSQIQFVNLNTLNAGPSKQVPVPKTQMLKKPLFETCSTKSMVKTNIPTKCQIATNTDSYKLDPETDSDGHEWRDKSKQKTLPWYISIVTREDIVKHREEKLKDPEFVNALYKCNYCATGFKVKAIFNTHNECCNSKNKDNAEFACFACSCRFESISFLGIHARYHSVGCHTYQCSTCEYTTKDIYFVKKHRCPNEGSTKVPPKDPTMRLSLARRQHYCPKCDYSSSQALYLHYQRYHADDSKVKCELCGKTFRNQFTCQVHMKAVHPENPPEKKEVMFCAPCIMSFYNMSAYRAHMKTAKHAPKEQIKFKCDKCPKIFHMEKLLQTHMKMHEKRAHKCNVCGKTYVHKVTLRTHIRAKHTNRKVSRDHICHVCGNTFTHRKSLIEHMGRHSDERPYKCSFCNDTFKYSGALYTHTKLKHKKTKSKQDDKGKTGKRKSAKSKRGQSKKIFKALEQSMETQVHEQSMESQESKY